MNLIFTRKLRLLGEFLVLGIFAGLIFQLVDQKFISSAAFFVGGTLGIGFGIMDLFLLSGLRKYFIRLPLIITIFLKSLIYVVIIYAVIGFTSLIWGFSLGLTMVDYKEDMLSWEKMIMVIYSFVLFILFTFYTQINLLLGEGVLLKFLLGKYRKPTSEHRIFMFLDLKSSTTLAEKLGLVKYYSLLNDFFHEISEPVLSTKAEVYQYIGDEIVFTWKTDDGLENANCLNIFYQIHQKVYENRKYYREKYGEVPQFKAGVHIGQVISAQIGDIKREIVYNGDVLNTSARIQEQCNKLNRVLLISGNLLNDLQIENEYKAEKIDTVKLRGKEEEIELYSLCQF